jgi:hypothetical protein
LHPRRLLGSPGWRWRGSKGWFDAAHSQ